MLPETHVPPPPTLLHSIFLAGNGARGAGELPPRIALNIHSFQDHHPDFSHSLWDDERGRDFLSSRFGADVVEAWDEPVPLAYKADLLRYCILFQLGCIYSDLSLQFFSPLVERLPANRAHLFRDGFSAAPWILSNSLVAAPAGERVFEQCIRSILEHTQTQYYGINQLCPTGPNLFGRQVALHLPLERLRCGETVRINRNPDTYSYAYLGQDGEVIAVNIKRGAGLSPLGGRKNDYNQLYAAKQIYRSQLHLTSRRWSAEEYRTRGFIRPLVPRGAVTAEHAFPAGFAFCGPYTTLHAGRYRARFRIREATSVRAREPLEFYVDVCSDHGRHVLYTSETRRAFAADPGAALTVEFELPDALDDVEVRLVLHQDGEFLFDGFELDKL